MYMYVVKLYIIRRAGCTKGGSIQLENQLREHQLLCVVFPEGGGGGPMQTLGWDLRSFHRGSSRSCCVFSPYSTP
jgi:hypothetical protein